MRSKVLKMIQDRRRESCQVKEAFTREVDEQIAYAGELLCQAVTRGNGVYAYGNGGSAADAQHFIAELVGRFERERAPIKAVAFTTNSSCLTAIGNDYGFDTVFERPTRAWVKRDDVVLAISTSGNSPNILRGVKAARDLNAHTVALTGRDGGALASLCEVSIHVPSDRTSRIQEAHILILHILAEQIENVL